MPLYSPGAQDPEKDIAALYRQPRPDAVHGRSFAHLRYHTQFISVTVSTAHASMDLRAPRLTALSCWQRSGYKGKRILAHWYLHAEMHDFTGRPSIAAACWGTRASDHPEIHIETMGMIKSRQRAWTTSWRTITGKAMGRLPLILSRIIICLPGRAVR